MKLFFLMITAIDGSTLLLCFIAVIALLLFFKGIGNSNTSRTLRFAKYALVAVCALWLFSKLGSGSSTSEVNAETVVSHDNLDTSSNSSSNDIPSYRVEKDSKYTPCLDCNGKGLVKLPDGYNMPCEKCSGTGRIARLD